MKIFIKNNLKKLVISSVVILCPIIFGLILWNDLPELIAIHYDFSGNADRFSGKAFAVFGLPLIMLAIHWLCMLITSFDKKNIWQNSKAFGMIFYIMPLTSLFVSAIMYSIILDAEFNFISLSFVFLGALFTFIGNYLPKCKQNRTIGIKLKWTLASEENWNMTHRFGGKVWVTGGIIITLLTFLPLEISFILFIPTVILLVLIPAIYSARYFKAQVMDGRASSSDLKNIFGKNDKITAVFASISVTVILVLCAVLCFTGNIEYKYSDSSFTVKADYYNDLTINYNDITEIEHRENDDRGVRVFGFGTPRLLMGTFENQEFGRYTRYSYAGCSSCVVITVNENKLVLSGIDSNATSDIYNILIEKCN